VLILDIRMKRQNRNRPSCSQPTEICSHREPGHGLETPSQAPLVHVQTFGDLLDGGRLNNFFAKPPDRLPDVVRPVPLSKQITFDLIEVLDVFGNLVFPGPVHVHLPQ